MNVETLWDEGAAALRAAGIGNARNEARWLLEHVLGTPCAPFGTQVVPAAECRRYRALVKRRAQRVPLQYLAGAVEFAGIVVKVTPSVLIPRPETEELVELARGWLVQHGWAQRVADLGTGSGCIAVALARMLPAVECWASDVSRAALRVARENARRNGVAERMHFACGSWFECWGDEMRFDMIITNPPYVERGARVEAELGYEPEEALYAGADGLGAYREILPEVPRRLNAGGIFFGEMGAGQAAGMRGLARACGIGEVEILSDAGGRERFVKWERGREK